MEPSGKMNISLSTIASFVKPRIKIPKENKRSWMFEVVLIV